MTGTASFSVMSEQPLPERLEPMGKRIQEKDCSHWLLVLIFFGKAAPNHQNLVSRVLDENGADGILDAELKTGGYGFPFIYQQSCVYLEGELAKVKGGES